jgi:hypothetical protein
LQVEEHKHQVVFLLPWIKRAQVAHQEIDLHPAFFRFFLRLLECHLADIHHRDLPAQFGQPDGVTAHAPGQVQRRTRFGE